MPAAKEKDDDDDKKKKGDDEEEIVAVTDETPPKKKADDDSDEGDDADDADELEVAAKDSRLGESEEEVVEQERDRERTREERRNQRKSRNKARREWGDRMVRENRFLTMRNEQLEKAQLEAARRLDALEGVTVEGRIGQFRAAIAKADDAIAEAVTNKDGAAHKEATRIRDNLKEGLSKLEDMYTQQQQRRRVKDNGGTVDNAQDPVVLERTREWASQHASWFGKDQDDTAIAMTVDDRLKAEGVLDPRSEEYWQELDSRIQRYLPHRFKGGNGKDRDGDEGDDLQEETRSNGHGAQPRRSGGGGPKFRSGGGDRQLGPNEVYLTRERLDAMREAGIEEGSPEYKRLLKRYQQWDRENTNSRAR